MTKIILDKELKEEFNSTVKKLEERQQKLEEALAEQNQAIKEYVDFTYSNILVADKSQTKHIWFSSFAGFCGILSAMYSVLNPLSLIGSIPFTALLVTGAVINRKKFKKCEKEMKIAEEEINYHRDLKTKLEQAIERNQIEIDVCKKCLSGQATVEEMTEYLNKYDTSETNKGQTDIKKSNPEQVEIKNREEHIK